MKKRSCIINNETGFFLPYVLFITALVFVIITASIRSYQHEVDMTHHHIEHLKAETIVQTAFATFIQNELPTDQSKLHVDYAFPDGEVTLVYNFIDDFEYRLHFTVLTKNGLEYTALIKKEDIPNID